MAQYRDSFGGLLRQWRQRRRLSQLGLAVEAEISQRHLSFLESGRSHPSRDMVMQLIKCLEVPLRERNVILNAAGYAPHFPQHPLDAPELSVARDAIERILHGHLPHPAMAVDRHWTLISANAALSTLLTGIATHLLEGKVNVLRLSLHPDGLARRILNLGEWRNHVLTRLGHEIEISADPVLAALRDELIAFPCPDAARRDHIAPTRHQEIAVPLRLKSADGPLSFLSTTTIFGTAINVTLSEVTIEAFFPADRETEDAMAGFNNGR
ncbi:helix-turn-helix domain-containing protein [Puniceibacterium sp. IMCC21224]|uniref:MmyB family transcriptional regulator n=1 Tax=Puniceibacterium sp. IMCC21224 TaxID=1618204 RepID=UPI00064D826F|nr:helix-turn-helix domain-containing protein [Puniceibacterium sp. IMCC21224]KMK64691.1 putative transcriptional regulator [Puniceibacterium sp. IMCC21224]